MPTNRELAQTDPEFLRACALAGITPNKVQYHKWRQRRGAAYLRAHNTVRTQKQAPS